MESMSSSSKYNNKRRNILIEIDKGNEVNNLELGMYDLTYYYEDEPRFIVDEIKNLVRRGYSYKDIAILYRTNVISRNIEMALIENGIPYLIYGGFAFLKRREIKDLYRPSYEAGAFS